MTPQSCIGKQSMSLLFHLLHIWKQEGRGHWAVIYIDNQSFISTHITLFVGSKLIEFWLVLNCPHFPLIILIYKRCNFVYYHWGLYINLSSIVFSFNVPDSKICFRLDKAAGLRLYCRSCIKILKKIIFNISIPIQWKCFYFLKTNVK